MENTTNILVKALSDWFFGIGKPSITDTLICSVTEMVEFDFEFIQPK